MYSEFIHLLNLSLNDHHFIASVSVGQGELAAVATPNSQCSQHRCRVEAGVWCVHGRLSVPGLDIAYAALYTVLVQNSSLGNS